MIRPPRTSRAFFGATLRSLFTSATAPATSAEVAGHPVAIGPYRNEQAARHDLTRVTGAPQVLELKSQAAYFGTPDSDSTVTPEPRPAGLATPGTGKVRGLPPSARASWGAEQVPAMVVLAEAPARLARLERLVLVRPGAKAPAPDWAPRRSQNNRPHGVVPPPIHRPDVAEHDRRVWRPAA